MKLDQINPRKVRICEVLSADYHLNVGQIVKVYWNKNAKEYRTISGEVDQHGKTYCGNWTIEEPNFRFLSKPNKV